MGQIRLFLNGVEVELNEDVSFVLNQYFEDTSKPTLKYITFSKTVSIPFTINNNRLFGGIYSPDRVITYDNTGDFTNIHFDPYKKIDMRLQNDDDVLMVGYAKMLSVDWDGEKGVYNLNLYGELGKVFGELSKVTFDKTNIEQDTQDYFIDGGQYYNETMGRQLIYDSWNNNRTYRPLVKITDSHYEPHNIVGWTPLNIRYDSDILDQKSFELGDGTTKTFTDALGALQNPSFVDATKCNPDTAIGDGLMPREIGEWRCYLQQPFMYFDKLMQIMADKCKLLTGYEFWLDSNWFSSDNPFYDKAVFTLKNFEKDDFVTNTYSIKTPNRGYTTNSNYTTVKGGNLTISNPNEAKPIYHSQYNEFGTNFPNVGFSYIVPVKFWDASEKISGSVKLKSDNALIVEGVMVDASGRKQSSYYAFISDDCTIKTSISNTYNNCIFIVPVLTKKEGGYISWEYKTDLNFNNAADYTNSAVKLQLNIHYYKNEWPFNKGTSADGSTGLDGNGYNVLQVNIYSDSYKRTGGNVTLNTLWNNDYKPFDIIMQYCKMFRIGIFTDDVNKQVKFIPYSTYFSQYEILDWSDKLNKSVDYQIKPITYENKWVKFNYDDNSTKLNERYQKQFGVQFGEYKIDTHYVFNDETEELFDSIKCPLENTDNVLSWTNLYDNKRIVYSFPAEKYIYSKDDSGKLQDNFGTFYFDNGIVDFDTEDRLYLRKNIITDDSRNMRGSGKYVYNQYGERIRSYKYHQLGTFTGKYMMTFTVPSYTFCYQDYKGKTGLYETFWKNYLQERYDVQNKIVTCYLNLKNSDWAYFDFNKFIKIDNQLYFVNKIFDYNPASNEPTKCELITIQDIKGYTKDNYNPYLTITPETGNILRNNGSFDVNVEATQVVYVTSSVPTYTKIDGHTLSNATPQEIYGGKHTITTSGVPAGTNSVVITFRSGTYTKTLTLTIPTYFELYKYDAIAIGGRGDKIEDNSTIRMQVDDYDTWLLVSSSSWTWSDINNSLQDFKINGTDGNGSGSGSLIGEELSIDTSRMTQGSTGVIKFTNADGNIINVNIEIA